MGTEPEKVCHCFIDTNVFLHYQSFTTIDWPKELMADRVVLVVCSTVLEELDEKKLSASDRGIRQKARDSISKLWEMDEESREVNSNVNILLLAKEPTIDWDSEDLSRYVKDDRIIATILSEGKSMENPTIITSDSAMRLKAKDKGISCHVISDEWLCELEESGTPLEETPLGILVILGSVLSNALFLALWFILQFSVNYLIRKIGLNSLPSIDQYMLRVFQYIFAVSTIVPVVANISKDSIVIFVKKAKQIKEKWRR